MYMPCSSLMGWYICTLILAKASCTCQLVCRQCLANTHAVAFRSHAIVFCHDSLQQACLAHVHMLSQ